MTTYYLPYDPQPGADGVRRYGEHGFAEKHDRCRAAVTMASGFEHQCRRRRGHGRQHAFCSQHARLLSAEAQAGA